MSKLAVGQFSTSNVLLEDSQVQLSFPAATDKNGDTVAYYAKIYWQPIYCSVSGENYISIETTDVVRANTEIPLTVTGSTTLQSTITLNFDNKLSTDVRIYIEVIARDGINDHPDDPPVLTSDYYYVIRHQIPTLVLNSAEWVPGTIREVQLNGSIVDYGFTTPGNLADLLPTDLTWQAWRTGLETALGSINLTFNFKIAYSSDNVNFSTPATHDITVIKELIKETPSDAAYTNDLDFSFSFNKDTTIPIPIESITQENSYFFKAYISSSHFTLNLDSNSTSILLTSNTPLFVMRNGIIQINLPKATTAKTGAIMAARGPQQDVINGQSLALYDLHTESGQSEVANSPSIGFFDNLHNLMAKVGINYNISTDTGDIEITNFLTNGNIILTPNGTGVLTSKGGFRVDTNNKAANLELNAVKSASGINEYTKNIFFKTGNKNRWRLYSNDTEETGSNSGSNFAIARYADDGTVLDNYVIWIDRDTGDVSLSAASKLTLNNTNDVGLSSTRHALQIGPSNSSNLAMDGNEIMARNNGAVATLHLNADGGDVYVNYAAGGGKVWHKGNFNPDNKVSKAGDTMTGNLNLPALIIDRPGTPVGTGENDKSIWFMTGGKTRWRIWSNSTDESGSNAGSNFALMRYDDDGNYIDAPFSVNRASGIFSFLQTPKVGSNDIWHAGNLNPSNYALTSHTHNYLPTSGGTLSGNLTVQGNIYTPNSSSKGVRIGDDAYIADINVSHTLGIISQTSTDRGYINFSQTSGNALGCVDGENLTWRGSTVLHGGLIRTGQCTLNSSSSTSVTFSSELPSTPYIVLTPVTTTNGVIAPKVRSKSSKGFSAVIGGSGFSNIVCDYIAIAV